jgi:DNA-binding protein YbaB
LQDLVVGAFADAGRQVAQIAQERLGPLTGGMGDLGLPES